MISSYLKDEGKPKLDRDVSDCYMTTCIKTRHHFNCPNTDKILYRSNLSSNFSAKKVLASFLNYMQRILEIESLIEKVKKELAKRGDFNVEDAFRIFEVNNNNYITEKDINKGLFLLNIHHNKNDVRLIMRRADIKRNGRLSYGDFFDLVTPFDKDYRNIVEVRMPSNFCPVNKSKIFSAETKLCLQNLFKIIINCERIVENIRISTMKEVYFNIEYIFKSIKKDNKNTINNRDLYAYFKKNSILCDEYENGLVFIRLDRNRNGTVELRELQEEILPTLFD